MNDQAGNERPGSESGDDSSLQAPERDTAFRTTEEKWKERQARSLRINLSVEHMALRYGIEMWH